MKKNKRLIFSAICLGIFVLAALGAVFSDGKNSDAAPQKQWYFGFNREIRGETIVYHSPQPDADSALLVRSQDKDRYIEWETEPMPENFSGDRVRFVWMAGIDVNTDSHSFYLFVNDELSFTFSNPLDSEVRLWRLQGPKGMELEYRSTQVDRYGDFMGYMFLSVSRSQFPTGFPLRLRVQGESAESRSWFMIFKHRTEPKVKLFSEQAILRGTTLPNQTLRADIVHLGDPASAAVLAGAQRVETELHLGLNTIRLGVPAVQAPKRLKVKVNITGFPSQEADILLQPVRNKTIYLLHHSHVDIGYTHVQEEVEKIQAGNIAKAIELAARSQDFPQKARFKWNTEVMWPLDTYMRQATPEELKKLASAVKKGWIGLDALWANELTGLCRPEELMKLLESARKTSRKFGVRLDAAMITDIPGYTWGLVPVLAQSGVKYLSIGTNSGHRIGHVLSEWKDRPFYWVSTSGQEKVLCWVHGKGYSWFHTGLGYSELKNRLQETPIFEYLSELEAENYPYDILCIRYNIGSDNGPPDPTLAETVKAWNEKYSSPQMIIATTSEMFQDFEAKYGDKLSAVRGDFTGCWEDGAASSARETALNRQAAERLIQAETLWTIRRFRSFPMDMVAEAWRNILLYDEHTWGSWNSISDPESDFTQQQWKTKQSFALQADRLTKLLLEEICNIREEDVTEFSSIDVLNTSSWTRTDLVILPGWMNLAGEHVEDERGRFVPSQRLSTGELALRVEDVPPLGAKRLSFKNLPPVRKGSAQAGGNRLSNDLLSVVIDDSSGAIRSLRVEGWETDLVSSNGTGLNDYFYVSGRDPDNPQKNEKVEIRIREKGPLVASLRITSEAPGCWNLTREIRVIDGIGRVDITNHVDKRNVYDPEGVHIAFPFHVPEGSIRLGVAWGFYRPESDQLPGANKNYFTIQRWADVSNQEYGVTWTSPDTPLIEVGEIAADPVAVGWKKTVVPSQTLYSYIMNNYWETNYKASQEGIFSFHYSIQPHGPFNPAQTERFGMESGQPLIIASAQPESSTSPFLEVHPAGVMVTSIRPSQDGHAVIIRLYNAGGKPENVTLQWGERQPKFVYLSSPFEEKGTKIGESLAIPAFGIVTLRAENFL